MWNDNWVSYLDAMMHLPTFAAAGRELRLPTRIRCLRINPVRHEEFVKSLEDGTRGTRRTVDGGYIVNTQ